MRARTLVGMLAVLVLAVAVPAAIATDPRDPRDMLERYARDTWASFVAMTDAATGLPADRLHRDGTRSVQTFITNIGAYLWSTLVAEALGFVSHADAVARLDQTLRTLETMDRHAPSGQCFNWYKHTTCATWLGHERLRHADQRQQVPPGTGLAYRLAQHLSRWPQLSDATGVGGA